VVIERMLEAGVRGVRCAVRPGSARGALLALRRQFGDDALELAEGNLTRPRDVQRMVEGVDRVVHLAASLRGAPADMFLNTVVASHVLFKEIANGDVSRLVLVSSIGVYGLAEMAAELPVTEETPLDPHPERRDVYTHTKIRQELLLEMLAGRRDLETVVLRPGPLYGRGATGLPSRIGLSLPGVLLQLGGDALLPLSYVDHCADAVVFATLHAGPMAGPYNVVDTDLPTAREYLSLYRRNAHPVRSLRLPFRVTLTLARLNEWYHEYSQGQVPLILTPYRARNLWRGHVYDTSRLVSVGWRQRLSTRAALETAFRDLGGQHHGRRAYASGVHEQVDEFRAYKAALISRVR
jgi:nucleoside-diphosphate-sugar epimerase